MPCLILIVGGLLIMRGQHNRPEALFDYFRLEDQVPETHLLRLINKHVSFEFVRQLIDSTSDSRHLEKKRKTQWHFPSLHKIAPTTEFFNSHAC